MLDDYNRRGGEIEREGDSKIEREIQTQTGGQTDKDIDTGRKRYRAIERGRGKETDGVVDLG